MAAAQGAQVTAVSGSARRGQRLRALGAAEVVQSIEDTSGPFDIALESVGGASLAAALVRMSPRGTVLWFGQASLRPSEIDFLAIPGRVAIHRFAYSRPACSAMARWRSTNSLRTRQSIEPWQLSPPASVSPASKRTDRPARLVEGQRILPGVRPSASW